MEYLAIAVVCAGKYGMDGETFVVYVNRVTFNQKLGKAFV